MVVSTRGTAGMVVLVFASVVLLGCFWLAFGGLSPAAPGRGSAVGPERTGGAALLREADDLCRRLLEVDGPAFPAALRFYRQTPGTPETPAAPAVRNLRGDVEGGAMELRWDAEGALATGYLLEWIGDDGKTIRSERLPADARSFRDESLDAVAGSRTVRVTALGPEGVPAEAEQRILRYRLEVKLAYLGSNADGRARFRVAAAGRPPEEFVVAAGGWIGEPRPGMDFSTGWRFEGLRALRQTVSREVDVPAFGPDGRIARRPETGQVVTEKRVVPVPVVSEGAVVLPPDKPDVESWLPRSKD